MPVNTNVADPNKRYDAATGDSIQNQTWNNSMYEAYLNGQSWLTPEQRKYMMSNPWLVSNQASYTPGFWDNLFDPERGEREYYGQMRSNAMDWASKALENFRQQNYDSASQQVAREQMAGLNPDLNGQVTPGSAAENDESGQPPLPLGSSSEAFEKIGGAALKFFQFIMSGAQSIQNLERGGYESLITELGASDAARQFLINRIASSSTFNHFTPEQIDSDEFPNMLAAAVVKEKFPGYSRRARKMLQRMGETFSEDSLAVEDVKWALKASIQENKKRVQAIQSEKGYDSNFQTWVNNGARLFSDVEYNMWQLENRAKREGWKASTLNSKLEGVKAGAMNDLYNWVNSGGKWYNTLGVLGLPILGNALGSVASGVGGMITKRIPSVTSFFKR